MKINAEEIIKKKVTKFGNSGHINVGKRFVGKDAIVLIENVPIKVDVSRNPRIPKKVKKRKMDLTH